jgi:hypothetical protein
MLSKIGSTRNWNFSRYVNPSRHPLAARVFSTSKGIKVPKGFENQQMLCAGTSALKLS